MKPSTICQGAQGLILALSLVATAAFAQGNSQSNANWRAIDNQTANSSAAQFQRSAGASDPVSIAVVLKLNNPDALNSLITAQHTPGNPSYHQWLSSAESTQQFGPTQAQAQAVADYLTQNGFTHVQIAPNRLLVTADGTATLAQIAFNTLMGVYSNNSGEQGLLNTNVIQVPAALSQIDQVLGLDTLTRAHTRSLPVSNLKPVNVAPGLGSGGTNGYYPDRFASVYNRPVNLTGGNTTVAIVGWGDMNAPSTDLQQFESSRGIAAVPTAILSSSNQGSTDESAQSEWSMDAQAIVGISGGVKQLLFYTSGGTAGSGANTAALASVINQVVSDNTASVINMSWSIAECGNGYGYFDSAFALGASQGQTFSAASGDSGAYPCSAPASGTYGDTNAPSTVYPASSPNVIAVGGTTLTTDANLNYSSESAWPYSGGGISSFETKPDWQNGFAGLYRQVPDLAFDADWSYSPVIMYMNGNMYYNGGTSLAAPLFVGAWAVLESANSNTLGFAPSLLYPVASQLYASSALHDVTTGNNGYYLASAGYDNATGWGSFDITKMLNFLGVTTSTVTTSTGTGGSTSPSGAVSAVSGAIQADTVAAAITLSASPASGAIQANTAAAAITPSATPWTLRTPGLFEDTTFPTAALVSLLFPTKNPPLTNNWSCKPTAAHPEPVVFIHGTFENAYSNWAGMAPIIAAQGYCVYALNDGNTGYPSLHGTGDMVASSAQIAAFIAQVRTATGAAHVALIGHSQGGAQARYYADLLAPAGEVDTVIMIAPSNHAVTLSGLTTLGNLIGVPQLLDALKMPGQAQQSDPKSPFYVQLNGNGETRPGINYTVIATTYDEVATPYTQAFITAGPGATVDNITLQNVCAQDLSEHLSASYSKNVAQIILNKLDPANPHVIKCYTQAPIIGTTAPTAASTPTNTVTASVSGTGGTMSPSGTVSTASGATASFTLKPSTGYAAATVGGTCGGTLTGNTFKTNAITANCTVVATFAPGTYTVTPSAGANGAISPTGGVSVKGASSTTFTLKPNAGYVPS
ncbi:MAG: alpha/beta fold hydrolase, partial [Burkholderiaceae bacterium]|nr:alpha/beta fold hydrolase [Burkholderiaceae bacterium]